ncbi:MAG: triose-phosphate isomerase [Candidatus Wildermuthbacteria bacterium]|nr:triose-phosphate isomerase [Candidatus Wildermuthbacteria bacterium]
MKPLIVANWKMHPEDSKDAFDLAAVITKEVKDVEAQVVLCPPFVYIPELLASNNVFIGAQDCFWENNGAFTGEVSPSMLRNLGCTYVILGHSERSQYMKETMAMVKQKIYAALSVGLAPVVCVGEEDIQERKTELEVKLIGLLQGLQAKDLSKLVLVYEPLWAISTNKNARPEDPEDLREVVAAIRGILVSLFGEQSLQVPILYGGSVTAENIQSFLGLDKAQGALVGAASLDAQEFIALVKNASKEYKE